MKYQALSQRDDIETGTQNKIMDVMSRNISNLIFDVTGLTSTIIKVVVIGLFGLITLVAIGVATGILFVDFNQQNARINVLQAKESNSSAQINELQAYKTNSSQTIQQIQQTLETISLFNASSVDDIIGGSQTILNLTNLVQTLNEKVGDLLLNVTVFESTDSNQNTRLGYLELNITQIMSTDSNQNIRLNNLESNMTQVLGVINLLNVSSSEDIIRDSQTILNLTSLAQTLNERMNGLLLNITAIESTDSNQNIRLNNLESNMTQTVLTDSDQNTRLNNLESNMTQVLGVIHFLNVSSSEDIIRDSQTILNLTDLTQRLNRRIDDLALNITAIESIDSSQNTRLDNLESNMTRVTLTDSDQNIRLNNLESNMTQAILTDSEQNTRLGNIESNVTQVLNIINLLNVSSAEDIIRDSQTILNLTDLAQTLNGRVDILSLDITIMNNTNAHQNDRLDSLNETIQIIQQNVNGLVENVTSLTQSDSNQSIEISSITTTIQNIQLQIANLLGNISSLQSANQSVDISSLQAMVESLNETIMGFATSFTTANLTIGDNIFFTSDFPKIFAPSPNGLEFNADIGLGAGHTIFSNDPLGYVNLGGILRIDSSGVGIITSADQTNGPIVIRANMVIEGSYLDFPYPYAPPIIKASVYGNISIESKLTVTTDLAVYGTFSNPSDSKFKENIQLVDDYAMLGEAKKFNIYNYTLKPEFLKITGGSAGKIYTGFLADEIANKSSVLLTERKTLKLPSLVDNSTQTIEYDALLTTRIPAINTGAIKALDDRSTKQGAIFKEFMTRIQNAGVVGLPDFSDLITAFDNLR